MPTVYHDRLQMSFCGQCTLLWKWLGQRKREEKYNRDKKGKWASFWVCLSCSPSVSVHRWAVIDVMEIDFQVTYIVSPSVLGQTIIFSPYPLLGKACVTLKLSFAVCLPRRTALLSISICWTVSMTLLPQAFPLSVEHYLSIRQLISWSIRWRAMWGKSTSRITGEKERF